MSVPNAVLPGCERDYTLEETSKRIHDLHIENSFQATPNGKQVILDTYTLDDIDKAIKHLQNTFVNIPDPIERICMEPVYYGVIKKIQELREEFIEYHKRK